ncbi:hypothetical protein [Thermogemmatispora sp.]|uniref:hypothetical protein n=1 Tax=Thermogemmatispora sp. TaxID=1968838 RepID=UPI001D7873A1|nr:hypothetical protein [Thermogemmatispora sp.]MBX5449444.1 hypothetical protein [Thermogemmatispora sp.]
MRLEEHVAFSTAAALVALPWLKDEVWLPYVASILIDVDHYLEFVAARRSLSLREALRYLRTPHRQRGPLPKPLHQPLTLGALTALAALTRQRWLWLLLAGMVFHVSLDACNNYLVRRLQGQLQREAAGRCPLCAREVMRLELHARRPLRTLLARYRRANYVVLCPECHRLLHLQG